MGLGHKVGLIGRPATVGAFYKDDDSMIATITGTVSEVLEKDGLITVVFAKESYVGWDPETCYALVTWFDFSKMNR